MSNSVRNGIIWVRLFVPQGDKEGGLHIKTRGCRVENLKVNCYSGHTYAERPLSFTWQGTQCEVAKIEKAWLEPQERYFLVRTRDNKLFRLCYNELTDQWKGVDLVTTNTNAH